MQFIGPRDTQKCVIAVISMDGIVAPNTAQVIMPGVAYQNIVARITDANQILTANKF